MQVQGPQFVSFEPASWSRLRRFLARRVPRELLDDVAQSVACEAWASRERAEGQGFVYGVARNEAYDARRKHARMASDPLAEEEHGHVAEATFVHAELSEVLSYVERTPRLATPMRWLVLEHEGESFEEIGAREGIAPAAVRQRVSRLRRELRAVFAVTLSLALGLCAWSLLASAPSDDAAVEVLAQMPLPDGTWTIEAVDAPESQAMLRGATVEVAEGQGKIVVDGLPVQLTVMHDHGGLYLSAQGQRAPLSITWLGSGRAHVKVGGATLTLRRTR